MEKAQIIYENKKQKNCKDLKCSQRSFIQKFSG